LSGAAFAHRAEAARHKIDLANSISAGCACKVKLRTRSGARYFRPDRRNAFTKSWGCAKNSHQSACNHLIFMLMTRQFLLVLTVLIPIIGAVLVALGPAVRIRLTSAQKRPSIIAACWMQATLY
jgi:hypothetical protein